MPRAPDRSEDLPVCLAHTVAHPPPRLSNSPSRKPNPILHPLLKANNVSKLCEKIAGLQNRAKQQAQEVSDYLDNPSKLIETLKGQVKTVAALQQSISDLNDNKEGLTKLELDELKRRFKELADITTQNHQDATMKGIRLTPQVYAAKPRKPQGPAAGK